MKPSLPRAVPPTMRRTPRSACAAILVVVLYAFTAAAQPRLEAPPPAPAADMAPCADDDDCDGVCLPTWAVVTWGLATAWILACGLFAVAEIHELHQEARPRL